MNLETALPRRDFFTIVGQLTLGAALAAAGAPGIQAQELKPQISRSLSSVIDDVRYAQAHFGNAPLGINDAKAILPLLAEHFVLSMGITDIKPEYLVDHTHFVTPMWENGRSEIPLSDTQAIYGTAEMQQLQRDYPDVVLEPIDAEAVYRQNKSGTGGYLRRSNPKRAFINLSVHNDLNIPKMAFLFGEDAGLSWRNATPFERMSSTADHEWTHLVCEPPQALDKDLKPLAFEILPGFLARQSPEIQASLRPDDVKDFRKEAFQLLLMTGADSKLTLYRKTQIDMYNETLTDYLPASRIWMNQGLWFREGSYADPVDLLNLRKIHQDRISDSHILAMYRGGQIREYIEMLSTNSETGEQEIPFEAAFRITIGHTSYPLPYRTLRRFFPEIDLNRYKYEIDNPEPVKI